MQNSKRKQPYTRKQDSIRQEEIPHTETGQSIPTGGKESHQRAKESEIHTFPLLGVPQKQQDSGHSI